MAWALCLLTLLGYWSGAISQTTLTQPPSQSIALGQTVRLSCTASSNKNTICWVQQTSGQKPRYIQCAGYSRGDGVPARFTATDSGNVDSLTITNTQPEDEADYYCYTNTQPEDEANYYYYMWPSGDNGWIFGGGTQLVVTDANQPSLPPNVNLFPPSVEEKESKNKATLVCLVDGFRPPDITVTWLADGTAISTGVETTKATKLNDNYVASSYLTLNPSEWESHASYSCKVTHKGIDYTKSVGHSGSQCS